MQVKDALREVDRIHHKSSSHARWYGWVWLLMAIATIVFLIMTPPGPQGNNDLSLVVALAFGSTGAVLWFLESRQRVVGRVAAHLEPVVTRWYVGLMVAVTLLHIFVLPDGYTVWLVLAAMLPTIPCLIGAWKVLRS